MTWVAVGATAVSVVGGYVASENAASGAESAAQTQAGAQMAGLNYLKETERLPQQFREGGLTKLGGLYGLEGGEGSQQQLIDQAKASPYYQAMLDTGEEAILRNQAATGGLRSGDASANLAKYDQQLLADAYAQQLSGLEKLAQLPTNAVEVSRQTGDIGRTQAQGQIGAQQIRTNMYGDMIGAGSDLVKYGGEQGWFKKSGKV